MGDRRRTATIAAILLVAAMMLAKGPTPALAGARADPAAGPGAAAVISGIADDNCVRFLDKTAVAAAREAAGGAAPAVGLEASAGGSDELGRAPENENPQDTVVEGIPKGVPAEELNRGLVRAILDGDVRCVSQLMNQPGTDVNHVDPRTGNTPLIWAATASKTECVHALLESGASVDVKNEVNSQNALISATLLGLPGVLKELLEHGADPNVEVDLLNQRGSTFSDSVLKRPLQVAVAHGYVLCAQMLLQHGADCNSRDALLKTPLIIAASNVDPEMTVLLLQHGADINAKARNVDALAYWNLSVIRNSYHENNKLPERVYQVAKVLCKAGADPFTVLPRIITSSAQTAYTWALVNHVSRLSNLYDRTLERKKQAEQRERDAQRTGLHKEIHVHRDTLRKAGLEDKAKLLYPDNARKPSSEAEIAYLKREVTRLQARVAALTRARNEH